ncbi:MAG: FecR domain-containing protein [Saprospiraceae bacterium]|nr:FecR domain-containing protein [Saprospiraceae bacterium]
MKESEYILLLSKRFSGEITPAESAILDNWQRQSPENDQIATTHQRIWEAAQGYGKNFAPDLDADFKKVQVRINNVVQPLMRVSHGQRLMRVAAAIALLLASVWGWQQFSASSASIVTVSAENADPKSVTLPDGSQIWLREGSQLSYAEKWIGKERRVKLQGEGYFEVQHDPAHPFKVELANGGTVEVLGTQFDVRQTANQTTVLVRSGKVRFSPTAQSEGPVLTANQKAVFDHSAAKVRILTVSSLNELSWQTGGLEFVNTPLNHVVSDLEKFYGVNITLRNPAMSGCPHSAPLTSQPIEKVLETLCLTHQLKVKKMGDRSYELSGGECR